VPHSGIGSLRESRCGAEHARSDEQRSWIGVGLSQKFIEAIDFKLSV
jgi:hypothetical protein